MNKVELRKTLELLKSEVESLPGDKAEVRDRLRATVTELESQIDDVHDDEVRESMAADIPGLIKQFEADHPAITNVLNRFMTLLSDMGI